MKKVLIIKGFIAASIIAVLGQLTSCQNEEMVLLKKVLKR